MFRYDKALGSVSVLPANLFSDRHVGQSPTSRPSARRVAVYDWAGARPARYRREDGRELLQMRVDLGVLQLEATGRPDGVKPGGFETYYDYLVATAFEQGPQFKLDERQCIEVDREFYQFYHRRICWLTLGDYVAALKDAKHTLALMDFTSANAPDDRWALLHEQYRPFVLFHKVQAEALIALEKSEPDDAVELLDEGLKELEQLFDSYEAEEHFADDPFVMKLKEMRTAIVDQYALGPTLAEQLANAIAKEQYELAAKIRDRIARHHGHK